MFTAAQAAQKEAQLLKAVSEMFTAAQAAQKKVCPAVAGNAKCGACTACADKQVQVIVYPMH